MTRKTKYKINSGFVPFSACADRFVCDGYRDSMPLADQIREMAKVEGVRGVGFDYPAQVTEADIPGAVQVVEECGFELTGFEIGLYPHRKFKLGSIANTDPGIRREAVEISKKCLDVAAKLNAREVLLWPGQDGFDYPFQVDYNDTWKYMFDSVGEIAAHRSDVKIAIEYKPKEPRANCYIRNAGVLLWMLKCIDMPNLGGAVDFGHSLVAGENPAEAVAMVADAGKLFMVHLNDNYRDWDHDLMVASVNWKETLEFLYYVVRSGYDGWYTMDVFPYRENGHDAIQACVESTEYYLDLAKNIPEKELKKAFAQSDAIKSQQVLREYLFK